MEQGHEKTYKQTTLFSGWPWDNLVQGNQWPAHTGSQSEEINCHVIMASPGLMGKDGGIVSQMNRHSSGHMKTLVCLLVLGSNSPPRIRSDWNQVSTWTQSSMAWGKASGLRKQVWPPRAYPWDFLLFLMAINVPREWVVLSQEDASKKINLRS